MGNCRSVPSPGEYRTGSLPSPGEYRTGRSNVLAPPILYMDDSTLQRAAIAYDDLRFGERLDEGSNRFGRVFKGELHGMSIVIKELRVDAWDTSHCANEIRLLSTLRHRNVVLFVGFSTGADDTWYLVTEYMERGDLGSIQKDPSTARSWTDQLLEFLIDICRGMAYLHAQEPEYIHGNLKAANVLISANGQVAKLADCGLARLSTELLLHYLNMPFWMAPEMLRHDTCTSTVDVYSFGIVLAEIDTRKTPYHDLNRRHPTWFIHEIVYNKLRPTLSENVPKSIANIYQRCVLDDPNGRPSFDQLKAEFKSLRETLAAEVQECDIDQDALSIGTRTNDNFRVGGEDLQDTSSMTLPDDIGQVDFQPARVRSVARDTERNPALDRLYHALQRLEQQTANAPIAVAQELDFAKDALSARLNGDFCVEQKMAAC